MKISKDTNAQEISLIMNTEESIKLLIILNLVDQQLLSEEHKEILEDLKNKLLYI